MKRWLADQHFRSLLKNTSYLAVSKGIAAIASLVTLAMAGRALGLATFGLLVLIASYAQAANGLSKFQSWQMIVRFGGPAMARGETAAFRQATNFGIGLDLLSGFAGMAAALLLLPFIAHWFGITPDILPYAMAYCLLIPTMASSSPSGVLRVFDRFDLISWQGTVSPIARAILSTFAYFSGWGLPGFVLVWAVTDLASDIVMWFFGLRELRRGGMLRGTRPTLSSRGLSGAWRFAIHVNLTYSLQSAWNPIARLIVGGLLGPASAAAYRVAASLADSAQKPADLLAKAYYPEVVRMDLASKHPWRLMLRGTALAAGFGLIAILLLVLGGRPLIGAVFGPGFAEVYPVLLVMVGVPLLAIISFPLPPMLYALDRASAPLTARIVGVLAYFAVIVPLAQRFDTIGAAMAMVLGHFVMVTMLAVQLRREHRVVRSA